MKRVIFLGAIFIFLKFATLTSAANASFSYSAAITYELTSDFKLKASYILTIKNKESLAYAPGFTFSLKGFNPEELSVYEGGIKSSLSKVENGDFKVSFKNPAVGVGASRKFVVSFIDSSLVDHTTELTTIRIPQVLGFETFENFTAVVKVPSSFSKNFDIAPNPSEIFESKNFKNFSFKKEELTSPIVLNLGEFQDYAFKITYLSKDMRKTDRGYFISIPPNTSYQQVSIKDISLNPSTIEIDEDGNWNAIFKSKPADDIVVTGDVRVFGTSKRTGEILSSDQIQNYLKSSQYWEVNDQNLKKISEKLSSPLDIYNYVVKSLTYNYKKTNRPVERLGATNALAHPQDAICMEFTDLFITLMRIKGIPAREVNGYAYTTNPELQPLSLSSDILHSWPEYWDESQHTWVQVDPTWGHTTNGVDYFSKFDRNHIAFVIHGKSSTAPITPGMITDGSVTKKLIQIERGERFLDKKSFDTQVYKTGVPFLTQKTILEFTNTGSVAVPAQFFDVKLAHFTENFFAPEIPPFGSTKIILSTNFNDLKNLDKLSVVYDGKDYDVEYKTSGFLPITLFTIAGVLIIGLLIYIIYTYAYKKNKIS